MIRRAALRDAEAILACLRSAFAPYQDRYTSAAFEDTVLTPELLDERIKAMTVFLAETDSGKTVGTIACSLASKVEGHLRGMGVLPDGRDVELRSSSWTVRKLS